jgi:hypothetical protein
MFLLYLLFAKFVPVISVWEMKAGLHHQAATPHASKVTVVPPGSDIEDNPLPLPENV